MPVLETGNILGSCLGSGPWREWDHYIWVRPETPSVPGVQDNSKVGIRATISRLSDLLQGADPELWYHLVHKNKVRQCCNIAPSLQPCLM